MKRRGGLKLNQAVRTREAGEKEGKEGEWGKVQEKSEEGDQKGRVRQGEAEGGEEGRGAGRRGGGRRAREGGAFPILRLPSPASCLCSSLTRVPASLRG